MVILFLHSSLSMTSRNIVTLLHDYLSRFQCPISTNLRFDKTGLKRSCLARFLNNCGTWRALARRQPTGLSNEQPWGKPRSIEDFSLKSLRMRGNKSPAPPAGSAPRGGVLNPEKATPLINILSNLHPNVNM
jgi:hypothetical protein